MSVKLVLDGSAKIKNASMQQIAPGNASAENTLTKPDTVKPTASALPPKGNTVEFTAPALSASAITISLQ